MPVVASIKGGVKRGRVLNFGRVIQHVLRLIGIFLLDALQGQPGEMRSRFRIETEHFGSLLFPERLGSGNLLPLTSGKKGQTGDQGQEDGPLVTT